MELTDEIRSQAVLLKILFLPWAIKMWLKLFPVYLNKTYSYSDSEWASS